ncbi:MAG: 1,4-alpha-glucan branching protein [Sphingobacteriia bacterium]|nr:MAG: 1,4-alpha-glucan branching protein [Sphingobacteriia bacterium]
MKTSFSKVEWADKGILYEVNIRQYTPEGTFNAFAEHLPRLSEMGISIIWLMPITPISLAVRQGSLGSYYACSSYTIINEEFGTLEDFKALIAKAHELNIKVIIDWVANHTGWDHPWTIEHPNWYIKDELGNFTEKNGWHDVIDLNFEVAEMRAELIDAMRYWVYECDIDGFRCDMAHLVPLDFWQQVRVSCEIIKPLFWLAECEVVDYHQVFDSTYAWWWMHETEKYQKEQSSLHEIQNVLHAYSQYPKDAIKLFFTSNHDENSWNGTEIEKYGVAAKAWAVFCFTWHGMPMIYSGQETSNNKRLKFFDKDLINWIDPPPLHNFYATLAQLRNRNESITIGESFILPSDHSNELMAFFRRRGDCLVMVLLNVSNQNRLQIHIDHEWLKGTFRNVFSNLEFQFEQKASFELQAGEYIVYERIQ